MLESLQRKFFFTEICKIFKNIYIRLFRHVTLFTVYEKETADEAPLEPSQEFLCKKKVKPLTIFSKKVLS